MTSCSEQGVQGMSFVRFHLEAGRQKRALPSPPRGVFQNSCFHGLRVALESLSSNCQYHRPHWPGLTRVWSSGIPGGSLNFPGRQGRRKQRVKRPPTVPVLEICRNKYKNRGGTEFTQYRNNVGALLFPTASPNKLDDLSKRWVALGATLDGRLNSP